MPLEISEIGINFRVDDGGDEPLPGGARVPQAGSCEEVDRDELVEDCVRRVLEILDRRPER
jgi:hypothetical protein